MPEAIRFYLVLQLAAVATLPLAARLFPRSADRGWALAKPLGVFAFALADRWLAASGLLDLAAATRSRLLLVALFAAAAASWARPHRRRRLAALLALRSGRLLAIEALFLVAFLAGLGLRALDPGVGHTEQPMDLMLLANELDAPSWPPLDPWLAGVPIGYYTLGHGAAAALARVAGAPVEIAYNLALAAWFALAAVGLAGVGLALARGVARGGARLARFGAPFAATLVLVAANPEAIADAVRRVVGSVSIAEPGGGWWWWRASRLVTDEGAPAGLREVISEFPQFGFVVGDLHPHLLALPLQILAAGLALAFARAPRLRLVELGAGGAVVGAIAATNSWDLPLALLLLVGGAALGGRGRGAALRRGGLAAAAALTGGVLAALPHLVVADRPISALVVNLRTPSSPLDLVRLFGALLPGLLLLLAVAAPEGAATRRRALLWGAAGALGAVLVPALAGALASAAGGGWLQRPAGMETTTMLALLAQRGVAGHLAAALVGGFAASVGALAFGRRPRTAAGRAAPDLSGALWLAAAGAALVAAAELFYLRDAFETRLNTVFKLHAGAWPPLALAALFGSLSALQRRGRLAWAGAGSLALIAAGAWFGATIAAERAAAAGRPTLDAFTPLAASAPDELAAIRWVRDFVPRAARLLQAPGDSFHPEQCRIAAATARATLLGWRGHEAQWRGASYSRLAAGREAAAAEIYAGVSAAAKATALARFEIDYVLVGPAERARYDFSSASERALDQVAERVFARGEVAIWERRAP